MARILNTCDLAMAWGTFRNTLREAVQMRHEMPGDETLAPIADALVSLLETVEEMYAPVGRTLNIDAAGDAFESAGLSRALGTTAFRFRRRLDPAMNCAPNDSRQAMWFDLLATPEWVRAARTELDGMAARGEAER